MPDWLMAFLKNLLLFAIATVLVGWLVWNGIHQLRAHGNDVYASVYFASAAILAARTARDIR